jgi:hypothetical protein
MKINYKKNAGKLYQLIGDILPKCEALKRKKCVY